MEKISKNSKLSDILKISGADKVLEKHGLPCLFCPMAKMEMESLKLGEVCKNYGIAVEKMLRDLKKLKEK